MRVGVLGGSGMLGSMVVDVLSRDPSLEVTATVRSRDVLRAFANLVSSVRWAVLDVDDVRQPSDLEPLEDMDWVINCIGITKPLIQDHVASEVERAVRINALFPYILGHSSAERGVRVLQIATDCVYSGTRGNYLEADPHDPLDVYGKTKSLGEANDEGMHHLRCSIIGPEPRGGKFLLEWFLDQPPRAGVTGYANHRWNGVTTLHFARVCHGIIRSGRALPRLQHLVPADAVTKAQMLRYFARYYKRTDVAIAEANATVAVDRTLQTNHPEVNRALWQDAAYGEPPTVEGMVHELSEYDFRLARV